MKSSSSSATYYMRRRRRRRRRRKRRRRRRENDFVRKGVIHSDVFVCVCVSVCSFMKMTRWFYNYFTKLLKFDVFLICVMTSIVVSQDGERPYYCFAAASEAALARFSFTSFTAALIASSASIEQCNFTGGKFK